MELVLYGSLIKVSLILSNFLKSFSELESTSEEQETISQGRKIFKFVCINIAVLMVCDSFFSALSPFVWLSDVYSNNDGYVRLFAISSTIFYLMNTVFASLLLYAIYSFDFSSNRNDSLTTNANTTAETSVEQSPKSYHNSKSRYLSEFNRSNSQSVDGALGFQTLSKLGQNSALAKTDMRTFENTPLLRSDESIQAYAQSDVAQKSRLHSVTLNDSHPLSITLQSQAH